MIQVITAPHSGTHLLMKALGLDRSWYNKEIRHYHTYQPVGQSGVQKATHVISSLRHPRRMAESFRLRELKNRDYPKFGQQFKTLIHDYAKYIDLYLIVDSDDRDNHLIQIQDRTGVEMSQSWEVNKESGSVHGTHDIELDECPWVDQEFIDFYYKQIEAQGGY